MKTELVGGTVGTVLSAVGTATQTNEVLQTISLIITILGGVITFIVMPLVTWYNKSKVDGKIDSKEIKEATEIIKDGAEKIKQNTKKDKEV